MFDYFFSKFLGVTYQKDNKEKWCALIEVIQRLSKEQLIENLPNEMLTSKEYLSGPPGE